MDPPNLAQVHVHPHKLAHKLAHPSPINPLNLHPATMDRYKHLKPAQPLGQFLGPGSSRYSQGLKWTGGGGGHRRLVSGVLLLSPRLVLQASSFFLLSLKAVHGFLLAPIHIGAETSPRTGTWGTSHIKTASVPIGS